MGTSGVAIIGYGGFGHFLHRCWSQLGSVEVVAVAEAYRDLSIEGVTCVRNWRDLLKMDNVDIISIVTPPAVHVDIARECMKAGKHVLIEKPLATTLTDATKIIETSEKTGVVAAVDYMLRFNLLVEKLVELWRDGELGKLRRVVVENYAQDEELPKDHWFWDESVSGGILVEHSVHFLDIVEQLTDAEIVRVDGAARRRNDKQVDQVFANVVYDDGLVASHYHEFARPKNFERTTMRLVFDLAEFDLEGWIPLGGTVHAMVTPERLNRLSELPQFELTSREMMLDASSRPGEKFVVGGTNYEATEQVTGRFQLASAKIDVYADCVRAMMDDVAKQVQAGTNEVRSPLVAGYKGLRIALAAREAAKNHSDV